MLGHLALSLLRFPVFRQQSGGADELQRIQTGAPQRDLPPQFGKQHSVYRRFRHQPLSGVFERVFNMLSEAFDFEYVFIEEVIVEALYPELFWKFGGRHSKNGVFSVI